MNINDDGTITDVDLVDGVDLTALATTVGNHHASHSVVGNIDDKEESVHVETYTFHTSGDGTDDDAVWETAKPSPDKRSHHHSAGTYSANSTTQSTGIAPAGTYVDVTDAGNVECKTVKAVCPKDLWAKYQNHKHGLSGKSGSTTPTQLSMVGDSNRTYFHVSASSSGSSPFWSTVITQLGSHDHDPGGLELGSTGAGLAPTAVGSYVDLDADNNRIVLDGNVNGVDVSAFDAHVQTFGGASTNGRHQGTGESAEGGATSSQLFAGGADTWFDTTSGWVRAYVYVNTSSGAMHKHGGTGLSGRKA